MLEGGGKTPILNPIELEDLGYKVVVYPLSLLGVSIRAMQVASSSSPSFTTKLSLHKLWDSWIMSIL